MEIININDCPAFTANDGAIVRELVSPRNSSAKYQSLAEVKVAPGDSVLEHYHVKTEEVYYIIAGEGQMFIEHEHRIVGVGDTVVILPGQRHKIENHGEADLVMLVMCAPAYKDEDQMLVNDNDVEEVYLKGGINMPASKRDLVNLPLEKVMFL